MGDLSGFQPRNSPTVPLVTHLTFRLSYLWEHGHRHRSEAARDDPYDEVGHDF
jgi:hypothetical protein